LIEVGSLDRIPLGRRIRQNVALLSTGGGIAALVGVATVGLNARALSASGLGVLALLDALVIMTAQVCSFDTARGIIRFGSAHLETGDIFRLRCVIALGFGVDFFSSILAVTTGTLLLIFAAPLLGVPADLAWACFAYVGTLLLNFPSAPSGVLRVLNEVRALSSLILIQSLLKMAVALILFLEEAPLSAYVLGYAGVLAITNLLRLAVALWAVRKSVGHVRPPARKALKATFGEFIRFSVGSWSVATLKISRQQGVVFLISATFGTSGAGYWAVVQRLLAPFTLLAEPLRQALYPEFSRLVAAKKFESVRRLNRQVLAMTSLLAFMIFSLSVLFGDESLLVIAGPGYSAAFPLLVILAFARTLNLCSPVVGDLVVLFSGMAALVALVIISTMIWGVSVMALATVSGLKGVAIAEMIYTIVTLCGGAGIYAHRQRQLLASLNQHEDI
jgi:O-antigen/teichoic acid export membrane protein